MKKPERLEYFNRTFDTEEDYKSHREMAHRRPLPMWCGGIMGGCVNCGGCI
jgi:hypothetical protein